MKKIILICSMIAIFATNCKTNEKNADSNDKPLQGTTWQLTHLYCEEIDAPIITPTLIFNEDGGLSGELGCNTFFGNYNVHKDRITLNYIGSTKKLCNHMELEKKYATALKDNITQYVIVNNILVLKSKNKEVMRFKAQ
ncbi:MAG: META domain-containing protein [Bacteroidales bacterium]|nr:META domain-containing protein [Bacteroidales bacterium]